MTTLSEIHDSATCDAANGQPCSMCAAAIEYETRNVISRVHQMMSEDCDCPLHRPARVPTATISDEVVHLQYGDDGCDCVLHRAKRGEVIIQPHQTATISFNDDWELAPLSMTRYVEQSVAEWWYQMGQRAKEREMLVLQNEDMREMLRVGLERIQR